MPDDIQLMRHMGFPETLPKAPGLRDFFIDIESSGIPFIREYKEALKKASKQNNIISSTKVEETHAINIPVPFNKQPEEAMRKQADRKR